MKKQLLFFVFALSASFAYSQSSTHQEVGITLRNLNSFGITYRLGKPDQVWRFNTLLLSGDKRSLKADSVDNTQINQGILLSIGREKRHSITEKLDFRYGADLAFQYSHYKSKREDKTINETNDYLSESFEYTPSFNLVIGFNYHLNDFIIGAEMLPSFGYSFGSKRATTYGYPDDYIVKSDISGIQYGLSNSGVRLSFVYAF